MTYFTVTRDGGYVGTTYHFTPAGLRAAMADRGTLAGHFPHFTYAIAMLERTPTSSFMAPVPERLMARMVGR